MGYPELPLALKTMLADEQVRTHHHLWHFVRNPGSWNSLPDRERAQLESEQWKAPRFERDSGAGIDFLGMHRHMIAMVNSTLAGLGDASWPDVKGWDPIPWSASDQDWPVPEWPTAKPLWATEEQWIEFTRIATEARSASRVAEMQALYGRLREPARMKEFTLDRLGSFLEWTIHGWMHIRWSGASYTDLFSSDVINDWLFIPWSSHVNKHFWKLHGWIDAQVGKWEEATGHQADLTSAWTGPTEPMPGDHGFHKADTKFLTIIPPIQSTPIPMRIDDDIIKEFLR